jgi:hypothetical protein
VESRESDQFLRKPNLGVPFPHNLPLQNTLVKCYVSKFFQSFF